MGIKGDRIPSDPKKRHEYEIAQKALARTNADRAAAQQAADADLKNKKRIAARDAKLRAEQKARREQDEAEREERQRLDRQRYMKTPLSEAEENELAKCEVLAGASGNPDPDMMRLLGDLRQRSKIKKGMKDEDPEQDDGEKGAVAVCPHCKREVVPVVVTKGRWVGSVQCPLCNKLIQKKETADADPKEDADVD